MEWKNVKMNIKLRFFLLLAIFIYFLSVIFLLKNRNLQLKYSLLWGVAGIFMFFIALFPDLAINIIHKLGIIDTNIGILAIVLFLLMLIVMSLSSIVSKLDVQNKKLVQKIALMEYRLRILEDENKRKGTENV